MSLRKSATKLFCAKAVSGKVVKHLLAYLPVHKRLVGDIHSNANFVCKVNQHSSEAAVRISAYGKSDVYAIFVTVITTQYEIFNNAY